MRYAKILALVVLIQNALLWIINPFALALWVTMETLMWLALKVTNLSVVTSVLY